MGYWCKWNMQGLKFHSSNCLRRVKITVGQVEYLQDLSDGRLHISDFHLSCIGFHNVESPSMVDPQWNMWYWGSKWNLHTVCWGAVGCDWGTISVYFGINYVCFIPSRLPVFAVEPQYQHQDFFIFVKSIIWRTHTKSSKKIHVGLNFEWGL